MAKKETLERLQEMKEKADARRRNEAKKRPAVHEPESKRPHSRTKTAPKGTVDVKVKSSKGKGGKR